MGYGSKMRITLSEVFVNIIEVNSLDELKSLDEVDFVYTP